MARRQEWNSFLAVKAAKDHYCVWCCRSPGILKGEKHFKFVGQFEGDFQSWRIHLECDQARLDSPDDFDGALCDELHEKGQTCKAAGHT